MSEAVHEGMCTFDLAMGEGSPESLTAKEKRSKGPRGGVPPEGKEKRGPLREEQPCSLSFSGISLGDELRLQRAFQTRKKMILDEIARHSVPPSEENNFDRDKSVKGFLDEKCIPICDLLNGHPDYVTTSSCSGRIALFHTANEGFSVEGNEERASFSLLGNAEKNTDGEDGKMMKRGEKGSWGGWS